MKQLLQKRLPKLCSQMEPREATLLQRLSMAQFEGLDDDSLHGLPDQPKELVEMILIGQVYARLAHRIYDEVRRNPEQREYDKVLRQISVGFDGYLQPDFDFHRADNKSILVLSLHKMLEMLSQQEPQAHKVILLRHFGHMTRDQISRVMDLSSGRVRRLEDQAFQFIKTGLRGDT